MKRGNCIYTKRLIDKLIRFNTRAESQGKTLVDIKQIKKAISCAKKYHEGQFRHSEEPFYSHPLEVAYMVSDYLFRTDILVTAILHDTLEDTDLTYDKIAAIFGKNIADNVEYLTRIKEDGEKISSGVMVTNLRISGRDEILMIKLFDRLNNLRTIYYKPQPKINKTIKETQEYFIPAASYLRLCAVHGELSYICSSY